MATLKAHGYEILRIEYPASRVSYRSDGQILRDTGAGWHLWKRCKPGVDPEQHAQEVKNRRAANLAECPERAVYENLVISLGSLRTRRIFVDVLGAIGPQDPDGIYSEIQDYFGPYQTIDISFDEVIEACRAAEAFQKAYKRPSPEAPAW